MFEFLKAGYEKVKGALAKTRSLLSSRIKALFGKPWDDSTFDELEQILFESDLGSACAQDFVEHLKLKLRTQPTNDIDKILAMIQAHALEILSAPAQTTPLIPAEAEPLVILIVGVNGSGKTTSIAKLAKRFQAEGKKVILAAGDTFRAAAIDQLSTWAERLNIEIVKAKPGSDPSAVAFDALTAAKNRKADVVLIDTAGRLQNKTDLMQELEKVRRVCKKVVPDAPHETFLVLDATTGQNAIDQAQVFHQFTPLTGLILAKLDGSAKGGIVLSIYKQIGIPVRWIGTGEGADDFEPFEAKTYVDALFLG
ncbi:MAG: signal recognition particle-docking protein FtsY [Rhabdochlamydiaceae bacterium]|nr:signal recognition particle-docking protein FtsY [Rhabdochlamydiaceae bacterium]